MTGLRGCTVFSCFLTSLTLFCFASYSRSGKLSQTSAGVDDGFRRLCSDEVPWSNLFSQDRLDAWICSVIGSLLVALSGVFPLLVIPIQAGAALKSEEGCQRLKLLLSFAIGGLLGDVFLHLLPEAWAYSCSAATGGVQSSQQQKLLGLWVVVGIVTFLILEKTFTEKNNAEPVKEGKPAATEQSRSGDDVLNGYHFTKKSHGIKNGKSAASGSHLRNGTHHGSSVPAQPTQTIKISGYLNLLANCIDNFTHGLAVAGSFLVSKKVGFLTTLAILLHEIPHEVSDFAILLRAGFDRWSAAKMQIATALGGVLGACFAMCLQSPKGAGDTVAWILPFTSGGFLYIALVNVVPDLLQEKCLWNSVRQVLLLCTGIVVMYLLSGIVE